MVLTDKVAGALFRLRVRDRGAAGMQRLGSEYGGWAIPVGEVDPGWVCYTAGVGEDASFDLELARRGCRVVAIDPTPRAQEYVAPHVASVPNLEFLPYAIWSERGEIPFYPPRDPHHVSYSATNRQATTDPIRVPARPVPEIAAELGDDRVDLLKLDIEGAEYPVLASLDLRDLGVRVLCVEYHPDHGLRAMLRSVRTVTDQGYLVAAVNRTDVTFCRSSQH